MPGKIAVAHHSLTDWDFQLDPLYRSLAADKYISPPTSLRFFKSSSYVSLKVRSETGPGLASLENILPSLEARLSWVPLTT